MSRVPKTLELYQETWDQLIELGDLLGHDETEETVTVLIDLGIKAMSVTNRENRTVKLIGGDRQVIGEPCKTCGEQRVSYKQEAAVKLGVDEPGKTERLPVDIEDD